MRRSISVLFMVPLMSLMFASHATAATLSLEWDKPTDTKTVGHRLYYGTASGAYTLSVDVGNATLAHVAGLADGTGYCFAVRSYDSAGQLSELSAEVCGTTPAAAVGAVPPKPPAPVAPVAPVAPPVAPKGGAPASPAPSKGSARSEKGPATLAAALRNKRFIDLRWDAPAVGRPTGYRVEVGTAAGDTRISMTTSELMSTFNVADLPAGSYYIRVKTLSNGVVGDSSEEVVVSADQADKAPPLQGLDSGGMQCAAPPGAPVSFASAADGARVQLSWAQGGGNWPSGYVLQVGSAPGYQNLMTIPLGANATSLAATAGDGTYALRLVAVNACGASAWGAESILTVGAPAAAAAAVSLPGAPQGLTPDVMGTQVSLAWNAPAAGGPVTHYVIEVTTPGGATAFDTGNASTAFTHQNTPAGEYVLRLRAGNAAGLGPASEAVTIVVP